MGGERVDENRHERLTTDQRLNGGSQAGDRRRRRARGCDHAGHRLDRRDELVTLPVDGTDDRLPVAVVIDGLSNRLDPCRERGLADETIAPDLVEQFLLQDDAAAALHQVREDVEGPRLELDLAAVAPKHDASKVQLAIRESQDHRDHSDAPGTSAIPQIRSVPICARFRDNRSDVVAAVSRGGPAARCRA